MLQSISQNCNVTVRCSIKSDNQIVEIESDKNGHMRQLSEEIQQICLAEEIGSILKSAFADHNLKVALILARNQGWPIDYLFQEKLSKFIVVIPVTAISRNVETQQLKVIEETKQQTTFSQKR